MSIAHTPPRSIPQDLSVAAWLLPITLLICGAIAYANSFQGAFVFDDKQNITDNAGVHDFHWRQLLQSGGTRQIAIASFAANYELGGLNPVGFHVVNLAIHLAAGLLLYGLIQQLLQRSPHNALRDQRRTLAFVVSLLWTVHPLQTESVTYIVQRCESLMGLCYFACLYCVARGDTSKRPWLWYVCSLVAIVIGIGSKESMVTAPVAVLLMDRLVLSQSWHQVWQVRKWLYAVYLLPLLVVVPVLLTIIFGENKSNVGFDVQTVSALEYLRTQPGVIVYYLFLAVAPFSLCFDYGWPIADSWLKIVLPTLLLGGLLLLAVVSYRRYPLFTFAVLLFFLHLAPTSSVVPIRDIAVEHRMYVPLAAVLGVLVCLGFQLVLRVDSVAVWRGAGVATAVIAVVFGLLTLQRNQLYHHPIDLWSDVIAKAPQNYRGYNNFANALVQERRFDEALTALKKSLKLEPRNGTTLAGLANVLAVQGEYDLATEYASAVVQVHPEWANAHANLAYVLSMQDKYADASASYRAALKLNDGDAVSHANLAMMLVQTGDYQQAIAHYDRALGIDPQLKDVAGLREQAVRRSRAVAETPKDPNDVASLRKQAQQLMQQRKPKEARQLLERAVALDDNDAETFLLLGNVFDASGDLPAAIKHYERALAIDPTLARAHNNLGSIVSAKDPAKAIKHFEAALETDPSYVEALGNLGNAFARVQRFSDAVACYRRALELRPDFVPAQRNLQAVQQMLREQRAQR